MLRRRVLKQHARGLISSPSELVSASNSEEAGLKLLILLQRVLVMGRINQAAGWFIIQRMIVNVCKSRGQILHM